MKKINKIINGAILTTSILSFSGCGVPIFQIGANQYTGNGESRQDLFASAIEECKSKGLMMKPIEERSKPRGIGRHYYLDFKCLDSNSKEYKSDTTYKQGSDVSIDADIKSNIKMKYESN